MVGDIVERNVDTDGALPCTSNTITSFPSHKPHATTTTTAITSHAPALRPIQAVVGQPFPLVRTRRSYGRQSALKPSDAPTWQTQGMAATAAPVTALSTASYANLSAHVQPGDGRSVASSASPRLPIPEGGSEMVLPAGGSAQQHLPAHQWSPAEFEQLRLGYYVAALPPPYEAVKASTTTTIAPPPTGEAFLELLFQCLRSTVRKHQQLALEVLLAHLHGLTMRADGGPSAMVTAVAKCREEAAALRERCVHGPNCAPFLFFVLEVFVSAGHPAMVELAATCLLLLLRGLPRGEAAVGTEEGGASTVSSLVEGCGSVALLIDAISELGNPAGDAPDDDEEESEEDAKAALGQDQHRHEGAEKCTQCRGGTSDDPELPFSEVSELLRGPDARYGLEQLGFTSKVLATMHLLLYTGGEVDQGVMSTQAAASSLEKSDSGSDQNSGNVPSTEARHPPLQHGQVLFLELLLCGGVGVRHRVACRRVAEDPRVLSWVEGQLSAVVLGHRSLEEVMELMCVLQHLAHVPAALRSLICGGPGVGGGGSGGGGGCRDDPEKNSRPAAAEASLSSTIRQQQRFHETWLLFFIYVASTAVREVRTLRHVFAIVWSMLLLRTCAHQGGSRRGAATTAGSAAGLVCDMSDTLLTDGMAVGGAMAMEMWFLRYSSTDTSTRMEGHATGSLDGYFLDASRTALQLCRKSPATQDEAASVMQSGDNDTSAEASCEGAAAAQRFLRDVQWLSNAHFFATYITHMRRQSPAVCFTLCGSAVETQEVMRDVVRRVVMSAERIHSAFARLTSPLLSPQSLFADTPNTNTAPPPPSLLLTPSSSLTPPSFVGATGQGWVSAVQTVLHRWVCLYSTAAQPRNVDTAVSANNDNNQNSGLHTAHSGTADGFSPRSIGVVKTAFEAAALYANTRLAVSLADVYPAVARDAVAGYAVLLTHAYEAACLRLRDGAAIRLQVDELSTMSEILQLLMRANRSDSDTHRSARPLNVEAAAADGQKEVTFPTTSTIAASHQYDREVRVGAFFLLHSIAISKHCLDVVPLILKVMQLNLDVVSTTHGDAAAAMAARMSLLASLQSGIELTPVPVMLRSDNSSAATLSVTGAPRSWVMYPLYDSTCPAKHLWAKWLRGLLGLHHRVKDVVGWDGVLVHTLLWMLTHRRVLWTPPVAAEGADRTLLNGEGEADETEEDISSASANSLCALTVDLCAVLHDAVAPAIAGAPRSAAPLAVSAAASRTLEISLAAYSDVPSEEGLPLLLHAVLAYVAAHCSARAALAAVQVLVATPVLPIDADTERTLVAATRSSAEPATEATNLDRGLSLASLTFSYASSTARVCEWLQLWSAQQGQSAQSASGVYWSLDDIVSLVQLVGPHFSGSEGWAADDESFFVKGQTSAVRSWSTDPLWCARCLTEGLIRYYLQQRVSTTGALSAMEKAVLRSTMEELEWYPPVLWPQVAVV
jgi:hypothetical protein